MNKPPKLSDDSIIKKGKPKQTLPKTNVGKITSRQKHAEMRLREQAKQQSVHSTLSSFSKICAKPSPPVNVENLGLTSSNEMNIVNSAFSEPVGRIKHDKTKRVKSSLKGKPRFNEVVDKPSDTVRQLGLRLMEKLKGKSSVYMSAYESKS